MLDSMASKELVVAHAVQNWLPVTETWLYNEIRFLPGIENHVICERTENLELFPQQNIHALEEKAPWSRLWDKGLRRLGVRRHLHFLVEQAERHQVRVLHSHFGHVGWANTAAAAAAGVRHLTTFYGLDVNFLPRQDHRWVDRYQELFRTADRLLCEGPFMGAALVALGCPPEKVTVHHLGVDLEEIPFRPRQWTPGTPLRVLIAASFREKKGIPYAIEALGVLRREIPLEVTIIGDANAEPRSQAEKSRILAALQRCGFGAEVRLLGYQPHGVFLEEAASHHLFLSPSVTAADGDTEGGAPVSIIEMVASGMPVVSTRHCDIPHVLMDGALGGIAPERDVDALVEELRRLVSAFERWDETLAEGRRHVEREFNARIQGERLGALYREVAGP